MKKYLALSCRLLSVAILSTMCIGAGASSAKTVVQAGNTRQQENHKYLHDGNFVELDKRVQSYSKPGDTTAAGLEKMRIVWDDLKVPSIRTVPLRKEEIAEHRKLFRSWMGKSATPAVPGLLLVALELQDSWTARGGNGVASTVSPAQFAAFRARIDLAIKLLDELGDAGRRYSYWYELRLEAALLRGWNRTRYEALHLEAIRAFPDAIPLHAAKARYLDQLWYGSRKEVLNYIEKTNREYAPRFGPDVLYALLHANANHPGMFAKGEVDWKRFSTGYKNRIKRYPAPYNNFQFAWYACQYEYFYTFREQMAVLDGAYASLPSDEMKACESAAGSFNAVTENRGLVFGPDMEGPHMLPKP